MNNSQNKNLLTEGSIWKKLMGFAFPLFLGNLFQQLYNTADSLIVGNFLGSDALAAVSSSGSLTFLLVGFFQGLAMGAGVIIARYFGARQKKELHRAIHTTVAFGILCGILLTAGGVVLAPKILILMKTPADILPKSTLYFQVYAMGSLGLVLYNNFVGIMQAVGDSRHPLYYLIFSSLLNVALDMVFVGGLGMGVEGAALATIISQFMSAFLCLYRLMKKSPEEYTVSLRDVRLDSYMLKQIVSNGLPAGIQNSVIAIANVVVQSNINSFGKLAVAGCGAYSKVEGARIGILCSISMAEIVGIIVYFASPVFIAAFNNDPKVIAFGVKEAHIITLFYFLLAFSHCIAGLMRGAGRATVPMFVMLGCWCVIRVTYITIAVKLHPVIQTVFWAYPLTWSLSSILFLIFYLKSDWIHGFEKKRN